MDIINIGPDPWVDSLPQPIRHAYLSAECALLRADNVRALVVNWRADLLPGAIGQLHAYLPEQEVAVRAVEAELAAARGFVPFAAMGQAFPTAQLAALHCGWEVLSAFEFAAPPRSICIVDDWGAKGAVPWAEYYRASASTRKSLGRKHSEVSPSSLAWRETFS